MYIILFLDYDGVLHPLCGFHTKRGVELCALDELFKHAATAEALLSDCLSVQIVLGAWICSDRMRSPTKAVFSSSLS